MTQYLIMIFEKHVRFRNTAKLYDFDSQFHPTYEEKNRYEDYNFIIFEIFDKNQVCVI